MGTKHNGIQDVRRKFLVNAKRQSVGEHHIVQPFIIVLVLRPGIVPVAAGAICGTASKSTTSGIVWTIPAIPQGLTKLTPRIRERAPQGRFLLKRGVITCAADEMYSSPTPFDSPCYHGITIITDRCVSKL